jgi:hypothetical protein
MSPYRKLGRSTGLDLLAFPPPYKAWLTLSNDPDATVFRDWQELDSVIWKHLALPFGDSFFARSINEDVPDQVNLRDHPAILSEHFHDTMHTWGDYCRNRRRKFCRNDAIEDLAYLRELGARPRIWSDHADFSGNLLHRATSPAVPIHSDTLGYTWENFDYTLDLIQEAGVKYVWDGYVTDVIGQDRPVSRKEWYSTPGRSGWKRTLMAATDRLARNAFRRIGSPVFSYDPQANAQYARHTFPDSRTFYRFRRYGPWDYATIDGFGTLLSSEFLDKLVQNQGTAIVYTHIGKRLAARLGDERHIPPHCIAALERLSNRYKSGDVMISPTSDLLDYLVIRDHAKVEGNTLDFRPDGIAFETLHPADLARFSFGVYSQSPDIRVLCEGKPVAHTVQRIDANVLKVSFAP